MKVQIIINENQKKYLLKESLSNILSEKIKEMNNFSKKILSESSKQIGVNLEFLLGWGAAIGGFMGPVSDFVKGRHPELSDLDLSLIITSLISLYYVDNKELVGIMFNELKSRNLMDIFKEAKNKSSELFKTFTKFIQSLNLQLHKVTNILSYTFIIPLLPMLWDIAKSGHYDMNQIKELAVRIGSFATLTVSGILLKNLLWKLIKRFSK
jgi:hypothetical protein